MDEVQPVSLIKHFKSLIVIIVHSTLTYYYDLHFLVYEVHKTRIFELKLFQVMTPKIK